MTTPMHVPAGSQPADLWPAPTPGGPVTALVSLPGSKSLTNRALVTAAGAAGEDWLVTPGLLQGPAIVDCGLAGTVMRFVPAVAALAVGPVAFDGDEQARTRPMGVIIRALTDLGVEVDDRGGGTLPF